jgi:DNA-binding NarL/FixJ family response regulator
MHIARTVLLADDHEEFLAVVVRYLEPHFEVVRTFSNGQALLEEAFPLKPDLIVLDISMPVLNGLETAKRLKRMGSLAEIVFLTVHADPDFVHAAFAAGALGYVLKSDLGSELLPCLREAHYSRASCLDRHAKLSVTDSRRSTPLSATSGL